MTAPFRTGAGSSDTPIRDLDKHSAVRCNRRPPEAPLHTPALEAEGDRRGAATPGRCACDDNVPVPKRLHEPVLPMRSAAEITCSLRRRSGGRLFRLRCPGRNDRVMHDGARPDRREVQRNRLDLRVGQRRGDIRHHRRSRSAAAHTLLPERKLKRRVVRILARQHRIGGRTSNARRSVAVTGNPTAEIAPPR